MSKAFWRRVEELREERGMSPNRLSQLAEMSRNAYRETCRAGGSPKISTADGLARALDANLHYLVTGMGPREPYLTPGASDDDPYPARRHAAELAADAGVSGRAIKLVCRETPAADLTVSQWVDRMEDEEIRLKRQRRRAGADPTPGGR